MARGRRTAVSTHPRALSTEPGRTSLLTAASPDAISEDTPCLGSPSSRRRPSPSCGRASGGPCRAPRPTSRSPRAPPSAKRAIRQIYRTTFANQRDAVVCVADSWCFRTERDTARERAKYGPAESTSYTPAQIEEIARAYGVEQIRGATPRRAGDVQIGDALPAVVKGPLTVTSVIAFIQGWGSLYIRAHGAAFDLFERHPALGIPNAFGVPEPPERVHWDEGLARAVGVPGAYDYG